MNYEMSDDAIGHGVARPCRKCGMRIVFIEGPAGKLIPAHRVRVVYRSDGNRLASVPLEGEIYVSHFETCSFASDFSRYVGKRKRKEDRA